MPSYEHDTREWLEADGLGGFASGTVCGVRTRRYHALLVTATRPPSGRVVLVNGMDAWVETPHGTFPISTQQYPEGTLWPRGQSALVGFTADPWPTWDFAVTRTCTVRQELFVPRNAAGVALRWSVHGERANVRLHVRPFLSGRDYHGLHHENPGFRFDSASSSGCVAWRPYPDLPRVFAESNGRFEQRPEWFRNFVYEQERERGLDFSEELGSPGEFHWELDTSDAVLLLGAGHPFSELVGRASGDPTRVFAAVENVERGRRGALSRLERSADAYLVHRGNGTTVIAGYPWFTDWGRDTFIGLRGLCLRPARLDAAAEILLAWAGTVSAGMLPNRFPDQGDQPEYNSVDAALWYIIAVHDYRDAMSRAGRPVPPEDRRMLDAAVQAILIGYARGTRHGIRLDEDGLLCAGEPGVQLTWMDAKVGDWVVTPRIGKPVEVQALWLNALEIGGQKDSRWQAIRDRGGASFLDKFWNDRGGFLYDVVDVNHQPHVCDDSFRPNQIFAMGGLPAAILEGERARRVVDAVEQRLVTPLGLRSLDPGHPDYEPRYRGGVWDRDGAYHQGTAWPWLLGPFVEAWVRVRGETSAVRREARRRFVTPLVQHLEEAGLGHICEIADGDPPHTPRGCPFQAWSLGELLRLERCVLNDDPAVPLPRKPTESRTPILSR